ncbi:DUF1294 domain-containing protein [Haloferula sp. A504]|uniref:DUF1294 domain-containing protein n=1 Tax=Haloferula sp. A504 TaxID=3373601 RepID=UPI0031C522D4|nr:DUF1294 domain-containing protein [Verrucomicrobiaceae bacterium E54]
MKEASYRGVIVDWKAKSPFGFAEANDEKIFLHITNFVDRPRWPEKGDEVSFEMGQDAQGRICAQDIVLHVSPSVLGWRHLFELGLLLMLPALALPGLMEFLSFWWIAFCVGILSFLAGLLQWLDKRHAIASSSRVPEATLHLFELFGGWPGSFLGQRVLRHKISKGSYQWVFWAIVLVHQLFALDFILGGLLWNGLHGLVPEAG